MRTKTSQIWMALAATVFAFAGCDSSDDPQAIQQRVQLLQFDSCGQLESYIKEVAVREMTLRLDDAIANLERGDAWTWANGGLAVDDAVGLPERNEGAAAPAPSGSETKTAEPAAHTTTNTQVAGVDEPDFVKNDGKRILVLSGGILYAAKSWPPAELALAGKLAIEGQPTEMFLEGDQVVVFSRVYAESWYGGKADLECVGGYECMSFNSNATKVTIVDVAKLSQPEVTAELYLPGGYQSARRVGSAVRLVLTDYFRWPAGVRFYPDYAWSYPRSAAEDALYNDKEWQISAYQALKSANRKLIMEQPLAGWLPKGQRKGPNGELIDVPYECGDFFHANASVHLGLATVVSLNLSDPTARPARTSVVGGVDQIYASVDSLYLAGQHWWWNRFDGQNDYTYLHKFDIRDPNRAVYVASGGVEGHVLNQFAMDEHKGYLRVATTLSTTVEELVPGTLASTWSNVTHNRVSVLRENAGRLELTGQTPNLAEGERIYSTRFQGDRGYMVTYRQVDPLFTLDLSEPTAPRVIGELKVPGFSTYIHPLDDQHLLTIGLDDARQVKLSIFDVSDFSAPKEKFTQAVGTAFGSSDATYEHKAFNYFPERKLLAVPFSDYGWSYADSEYWSHFVSDVRVFRIDTDKGIIPQGSVSMKDLFVERNSYSWTDYYSPWVRRSVMASDTAGNEFVYAVCDAGIRVAQVGSLSTPVQTVLFGAN